LLLVANRVLATGPGEVTHDSQKFTDATEKGRGGLATGVLEGIHFAILHGAELLHAAVVAAPENRFAADDH